MFQDISTDTNPSFPWVHSRLIRSHLIYSLKGVVYIIFEFGFFGLVAAGAPTDRFFEDYRSWICHLEHFP